MSDKPRPIDDEIIELGKIIGETAASGREDFTPFIAFYARRIVDLFDQSIADRENLDTGDNRQKVLKYERIYEYIRGRHEFADEHGEPRTPESQLIRDYLRHLALPDEVERIRGMEPRDLRKELSRLAARKKKPTNPL